ncbi:MAG: DUF2341 domain-containing protein [archaeon]|nr:DUF2341 domain-containing protein [archaeon]
MNGKRGLSSVLTVLIIILLVLAAIGILWVPLKGLFESGSNSITVSDFAVDMVIKGVSVNETNLSSNILIRKNPGFAGEVNITAIQFVFEDEINSQSFKIEVPGGLPTIAEKAFSFDLSGGVLNVSRLTRVSIIPIYFNDNGKEVISSIASSSYNINGGSGRAVNNGSATMHVLSISITSPSNGANFNSGLSVPIQTSVIDSESNITKVEFFANGVSINNDTTSPYSYTWNSPPPGTYQLRTTVTSNGDQSQSPIVAITVLSLGNNPPAVSITSPSNGATFNAGSTVNISATATDSDGTVTKVEFLRNGVSINNDTTSPYSYSWTNVQAGSYNLTAKATDNGGIVTTSGVVGIIVISGTSSVCGNGIIESGEVCDDSNLVGGDGCSAICQVEVGWNCSGQPSACTPQNWFSPAWNFRTKLTISPVSSNLNNFPIYLDLSDFSSQFHNGVNSGGVDIRITKGDGITELPREIVSYNSATDSGEVWFKGNLSSTKNNEFYVYYGNAGASDYAVTATYGRNAVWTSYRGVFHFNELSGGTGAIKDATGQGNDATDTGSPTFAQIGKLGKAIFLDGANDRVRIGNKNLAVSAFTVSVWMNIQQNATTNYPFLSVGSSNRLYLRPGDEYLTIDNLTKQGISTASNYNTWAYITVTRDGTSATYYRNGVNVTTWTVGANNVNYSLAYIGGDGSYWARGHLDEERISDQKRSIEWISTEYSNQNSPSTFYSFGLDEAR